MTLPDLLEELKQVDPETYRKWFNDYDVLGLDQWQLDSLQGCIQQACEKRGWCFMVCNHIADVSTEKDIYDSEIHDYPAEALLAAYIAAVKKEEKQ